MSKVLKRSLNVGRDKKIKVLSLFNNDLVWSRNKREHQVRYGSITDVGKVDFVLRQLTCYILHQYKCSYWFNRKRPVSIMQCNNHDFWAQGPRLYMDKSLLEEKLFVKLMQYHLRLQFL